MKRQAGMTLIELMVASAIGMIVTLLAGALLVSANAAWSSHSDLAQLDDAGRFALAAVGGAVRQAGFADWQSDSAGEDRSVAPPGVGGLDAASLGKASPGMARPLAAVASGSDVLALRFEGEGGCGIGSRASGWSIFYVARGPSGDMELRCKYQGRTSWSADALVAGVDTFQVLYGFDADAAPDGNANQFHTASAINAMDTALVLEGETAAARERDRLRKTHWKRVVSVRVGLVLHGSRRTRAGDKAATFALFGTDIIAESAMQPALRERERRAYTATIALRN